ncbi:MAG: DEAD/DEAH box helicase, partial [Myxococcales bacterium]|nr:DEAD/DEAH box helicase [Myxococcales bacterium]
MSSPPSGSEARSSSFERLHPGVQRWIWNRGWSELREVQERAIPHVLAREDLLVAAPTAGGKTEAIFLPIASSLASEAAGARGLGCLCVSPLKALINDQLVRLEEIFEAVQIPVFGWHGDISQSRKNKALQADSGVLLITPESLEALFVRRGPRMA